METDNTELAQVGALFMRLYDRFSVLEAQRFGSQGVDNLTLVEIQTIIVIGRAAGRIRMSEIAQQLGVTLGTPTVTVDRLIKKGYVTRRRDDVDRRQVFVELTDQGNVDFQTIVKAKNLAIEKIFGILDPVQVKQLIDILDRIDAGFEDAFSADDANN